MTAGCLGAPGGRSDGPTGTASSVGPDGSETGVADTELPGDPVDWPDGPKERPDRPETLNESSVGSFARAYEYRYVYNSLWYDETSDVSAECESDAVERRGDAWRAVVTCTAYSNTGGESTADGTATSTVLHADWFTQTYVYWIDEESVHRERGEE
ncbi:hypothetical protein ACFQFH_10140 [Halobaculum halobium]|uniref:hypothetical protein n=1 Tax=Halobaculum halobium TaxID=3032281 RepID=UPI0036135EC9